MAHVECAATVAGADDRLRDFAAVFTSYGALLGACGGLLITHQTLLIRVLGVLTIILGRLFPGLLWWIPLAGRTSGSGANRRQVAGAPLVAAMFGLGWTPCIGPTLAAVLALITAPRTRRGAAAAAARHMSR